MAKRKIHIIVLIAVVAVVGVLAGVSLKGTAKQKQAHESMKSLFSQFQAENISAAKVVLAEDSIDIQGGALLEELLSILHASEPFTLEEAEDLSWRTMDHIFLRTTDGIELMLKSPDRERFLVVTDEAHGFAHQDEFSIYLPQLYRDVVLAAESEIPAPELAESMEEALAALKAQYERICTDANSYEAACRIIDEYAADPMFEAHYNDTPRQALEMLEAVIRGEVNLGKLSEE